MFIASKSGRRMVYHLCLVPFERILRCTMQQHFLHLSDLHFRSNWPEETDLVCSRFLEDIANQKAKFRDAFLIFSGDLVQAGGDPDIYSAFEKRISDRLASAGFPINRRICIPGNHDISRQALRPKVTVQQGALSTMTDEGTFNDNLQVLSEQYFTPTFENYRACEMRFAEYTCCKDGLGGAGWKLPNSIGVYCLNTTLCSFGGIEDNQGKKIDDKGKLLVDTRSLYRWLAEDDSATRILVMHHPTDWLANWAREELEKIIANNFRLIISGHVHKASAEYSSRGVGGCVHCVSPALFTRKSEPLGYSFITLTDEGIDVSYRQWTPTYKFVLGTVFADDDSGAKRFLFKDSRGEIASVKKAAPPLDTMRILTEEFEEAITCFSSKKKLWIDRDMAKSSEGGRGQKADLISSTQLALNFKSCVVRAPRQFGLTCLGRFLALQASSTAEGGGTVAMIDITAVTPHRDGVAKHIKRRCAELRTDQSSLIGLILDNWQGNKESGIVLRELQNLLPNLPIVILHGIDNASQIASGDNVDEIANFERLYLWSMTRTRIRELVAAYIMDIPTLEEAPVTKRIIEQIDSLNLHRTPLNCLTILKLLEQAFDDSPVNRTEMIGRVLQVLFFEFQDIPRYSTRPDLKDCERVIGNLCERLIKSQTSSFTKEEFLEQAKEFCSSQIIDLDSEILFNFLVSENVFIRKELAYEFRFRYWMYFFAAHRMYHSADFCNYILSNGRYAAFPEIIEFYTGIDRQREDAVTRLTADLQNMNKAFLERTGLTDDFEPWKDAQWVPSEPNVDALLQEITDNAQESALPVAVKEAIADQNYDRSKPYNQELATFLDKSTLREMVRTMQGAARALRNSDYVDPKLKMALMEQVVCCWRRVCQILAVLSPLLTSERRAHFEGMNFLLDPAYDEATTEEARFAAVFANIPHNVTSWYQDDIFSKKMGGLFGRYVAEHRDTLSEALILMVLAAQRSPGWEKEVDSFIERSNKNSYYLHEIFSRVFGQFKVSITNERTRQQLRHLAAKALAKHRGAKHPSSKVIEKAAKELEGQSD